MNIIFITLAGIKSIENPGIYADLMRKFRDEGHQVHIVSPFERREGQATHLQEVDGVRILRVRTLNIQKTNIVEKGIGTLLIEGQFQRAIKRYFGHIQFDLILYSTPPITFTNVVKYLKRKNPKAISYLLLKDIFPQNAVDIGMFGKHSLFNWYFRRKEVALYKTSDFIGCMSPANVEFIHKHNPYYPAERVEMAPNSVEAPCPPKGENFKEEEEAKRKVERIYIRDRYQLPKDKPIFIYGGNLGKPQGIDFLIQCLDVNKHRDDCFFVVVGNGTEYKKLQTWYEAQLKANVSHNSESVETLSTADSTLGFTASSSESESEELDNYSTPYTLHSKLAVKLMQRLPKEDYDILVRSCDVGLIFLDHRFTIPNYPSRLLAYLQSSMPVICATDPNTDMGRIAEENGYGYWCESNNVSAFTALVDKMLASDRKSMGQRGYEFLKANYTVQNTYDAIMKHFS